MRNCVCSMTVMSGAGCASKNIARYFTNKSYEFRHLLGLVTYDEEDMLGITGEI